MLCGQKTQNEESWRLRIRHTKINLNLPTEGKKGCDFDLLQVPHGRLALDAYVERTIGRNVDCILTESSFLFPNSWNLGPLKEKILKKTTQKWQAKQGCSFRITPQLVPLSTPDKSRWLAEPTTSALPFDLLWFCIGPTFLCWSPFPQALRIWLLFEDKTFTDTDRIMGCGGRTGWVVSWSNLTASLQDDWDTWKHGSRHRWNHSKIEGKLLSVASLP